MTVPHPIHLGSGWDRIRSPAAEVSSPGEQVVWVRRFGCPSGLSATDRLLLVFERPSAAARAELLLNGVPLPALEASDWEQDVTTLIAARNELRLTPRFPDQPPGNPIQTTRQSLPGDWGRVVLRIVSD